MDSNDSEKMEALVAEALERMEDEGPSALEEICERDPDSADALRVRVEWLLEAGLVETSTLTARDYPERMGDFRLIEPIGQGGMGVVYRAEQVSLGREVALKLVRPEQLYFPGALRRFQQEVTTVAALAHPGIVPIFAVGEAEGVPFFAMEHVSGDSLGAVLKKFKGRDPRQLLGADLPRALGGGDVGGDASSSDLFDGSWPIVCARMIREVAEALEHAHRRGILHRDVKPSNVMVTRGGRVMLVDFGLSSQPSENERTTQTGQRVGTLAYMAPEQLRGERELDARVDVYALGVSLYELLTLRLPQEGISAAQRFASAGDALPADLRKTDSRIPWELETVVQTAADPDPDRRYASAADMARDLTNVLENRPIEARRSSPVLRFRRWVQRHPGSALAGMMLVVGPTLLAVQKIRANATLSEKSVELANSNTQLAGALDEATRQRDVADAARLRAERHFERAYSAVELMLGRVGGEILENVPRAEPIRRALLQDALRLQRELIDDPARDRNQPRLYAATLHRAATLQAELGEFDKALTSLGEEAEVLDALLTGGNDPADEVRRGVLDYRRAEVCRLAGRLERGEAYARDAIERLDRVAERDGGPDSLWPLARARTELAETLASLGRIEANREELDEAAALLYRILEESGGTWEQRRTLAKTLHLMAGYPDSQIWGTGNPYDAVAGEALLYEAIGFRRQLADERPDHPSGLLGVAQSALALGGTLAAQGRFAESDEYHREALAAYEALDADFPARPVYSEGLATTRYCWSLVASAVGREDDRRSLLEGALIEFERLCENNPTSTSYPRRLSITLAQLGHVLHITDTDPARAERLLKRSLEIGIPLWKNHREDADLRMSLAWSTGILATSQVERGDSAGAAATAGGYRLLDPRPVEVVWAAYALARAIAIGRADGTDAETLGRWADEAVELLEEAAYVAPDDPEVRRELVDPAFRAIEGDERYQALLDGLGIDR